MLRTSALVTFTIAVTACAFDPAGRARELESMGVTVVEQSGRFDAMVASGPEDVAFEFGDLLVAEGIHWSGSFGLGFCGFYVEVEDFEEARRILFEERERRGLSPFWIWKPTPTGGEYSLR